MTPPAAAPSPPRIRSSPDHRSRLRAQSVQLPDGPAGPAPWWQATLARLEEREAEARRRLEEARNELHQTRIDGDRLSALLVSRDAALAESARREVSLREAVRAREAEAVAARLELHALTESVEAYRSQIGVLAEQRDAAVKRADEASELAEDTEKKLRATMGSLRTRTDRIEKLEKKLAEQDRKLVVLRQRSDRLSELRNSRTYRWMTVVWRVKSFFVRR